MVDISKFLVKEDRDYVAELGALDSKGYLANVQDLRARVTQAIMNPEVGMPLPWPGVELLQICMHRWSVWSGPTFSGKTNFLRFLMLYALSRGEKVLFCSLEEDPYEVLREFIYFAAATRRGITDNFIQWCCDLWEENLWIFNHTGFVDPLVILGTMVYACRELGVRHVVVDSLMKINMSKEDYEGQRVFTNTLDRACRQHPMHVYLVAHPRKTGNSQDMIDMNDVEGAKEILAQAHTIVTMQRAPQNPALREKHNIPAHVAALLRVWKQRGDHNQIGTLPLYFDQPSRQWMFGQFDAPLLLLPEHVYRDCGMLPPEQGGLLA